MRDTPKRSPASMLRFAGMGFDLAAAVGGFTLIGYLADRYWQSSPRWTLVGAVLGLVGGMYIFLRSAMAAVKAQQEQSQKEQSQADSQDDSP